MGRNSKIYDRTSRKNGNIKIKKGLQVICAILCMILVPGTLVGCSSYVSVEDFSALQGDLDSALSELDAINDKYLAAVQEIEALKSAQETAEKALEDLDAEYKAEYENAKGKFEEALESSNTATNQKLDVLNNSYSAAQQEIDSLKETVDSLQSEVGSLQEDYNAAQQEIESLKELIENLPNDPSEDDPAEDDPDTDDTTDKIKIYIDQGHNPTSYHNAGAVGNGLYEQDLTFSVGLLLADLLETDGRFEIRLSRPTESTVLGTDNDSSLAARVQGAADFGADYFISLHINSFTESTANGIEIYAAERDSIAYAFGDSLLKGLIVSTNLRDRGMKLNPDLYVLKNATMPAVLVEMGFISNVGDSTLLSTNPMLFANGIYDGILDYFDLEPIGTTTD